MTADHTSAFAAAAEAAGADVTVTAAGSLPSVLEDLTRAPAVGTPLPVDGVDYQETTVDGEPTAAALEAAETGVTGATLGIANYGSVVLTDTGAGEELLGLYPSRHVVVLPASCIVPDMPTAIGDVGGQVAGAGTSAVVATGPSATADMGSVVRGVHGPREVHVVVLEDR